MKKIHIILALIIVFGIYSNAIAATPVRGVRNDTGNTTINCGNGTLRGTDSSIDLVCQVCDFRKMFCGGVAVALITVTVIFVGLLTLMNKINWGFVLVMAAASIIFVNADRVAFIVTGENVQCSC